MALLRLTGKGGTHFYDLERISAERARENYLDTHGYPANEQSQEFAFDTTDEHEFMHWIMTGELPHPGGLPTLDQLMAGSARVVLSD